jgi:hypothetical protein
MARVANSMVTFKDLDNMVSFEGFSYVTNPITQPRNLNTCATKLDVLGYLDVNLSRNTADNQLVSYSIIVPPDITDELEINPGTIEVDICPQTYDIIVTSNTSWIVSESLNWATLSTTRGFGNDTITVTLLENTSGIRSGTITFSTADVTVNHTITQQVSSIDTLRLDPDEINAPSNGISYTINVGSNTSWFTTQGTDLSWIDFNISSGSGCNTPISVTIDPNGSAITRTSQITISTGNITKIHEISQIGQGT